jgi:type IV pilus assembly protein PilW
MNRLKGFTLMEMMIGLALSMIVILTMSQLTANTFGSGSRIAEMTKLSQDLHSALQLMSRDVRRASFSSNAILCYANTNCASDGSVSLPGDVYFNDDLDCFTFLHDRNQDGNATNDSGGGFRLNSIGGVGVIEAWTGSGAPSCTSTADDWMAITNPDVMDIRVFWVDDSQSYTEVIDQDASSGAQVRQKIRKIRMQATARLIKNPDIVRTEQDTILVRNNLVL